MNPQEAQPVTRPAHGWLFHSLSSLALASLLLIVLSGCARWDLRDPWPWNESEQLQVPDRVLPMWTDTILYQPGQPGIRGFGARVYFYGQDKKEPIEVDGSLIVYAFDAEKAQGGIPIPEKKYVFTADQLPVHHSKTNLGHSYSIWLPWDEVGGPARQISLITRFEGREGGVLMSDPSRKLLPGLSASDGASPAGTSPQSVHAATFEASTEPQSRPPESITINVSPDFARKLTRGPNETTQTATDDPARQTAPALPESSPVSPSLQPQTTGDDSPEVPSQLSDPAAPPEAAAMEKLPSQQRLSTHFSRSRYPARNSSESPPDPAPIRRQPYRARWLSGLPPTPRPRFQ
jgi:hypothetical protein